MDIAFVEKSVGYTFKDKGLLRRALTLSSVDSKNNNQTLEFFGDAILEFIVSEKLFGLYPADDEGKLTERRKNVVSDDALAPVSQKLGLADNLDKTASDANNKKAIPSAYEAVVAAIYLDGGIEAAKAFVHATLDFSVEAKSVGNYKGDLQELLQSENRNRPNYDCIEKGTPQKPVFEVRVTVDFGEFTAAAESKKEAEQLAAKKALEFINKR